MSATDRDGYLADLDPEWSGPVRVVDEAVMAGGPALACHVAYGMLMYTLDGDRRHWVCGIGVTRKGLGVRFLYGVHLDDPAAVLRSGTSTLMTMDFRTPGDVDTDLVTAYVAEAVAKHERSRAAEDA